MTRLEPSNASCSAANARAKRILDCVPSIRTETLPVIGLRTLLAWANAGMGAWSPRTLGVKSGSVQSSGHMTALAWFQRPGGYESRVVNASKLEGEFKSQNLGSLLWNAPDFLKTGASA